MARLRLGVSLEYPAAREVATINGTTNCVEP
jgi:hypothetical protein